MRRIIRAAAAVALAAGALAAAPSPAQAAPSVPDREWWFGAWQIQRIWQSTRGSGVTVAVLDTGVNAALPELAGAVLPGGDVTGSGTDGRTDVDTQSKGHGTSMAALIAGQGRGTGMLGVAPDARILPVLTHTGRAGENVLDTYPAAIRYAADHGAKVISMALTADGLGYPGNCPQQVQDAVRYAVEQRDAVVVAAAGNEGDTTNAANFPAACKGVLSVGALDSTLQPWVSTQRQSYVDVGAPGVDIVSVSSAGTGLIGSGTSPASALVSGAVALVRARFPNLSARQTVARILATVRDAGPRGRDDTSGFGAVRPFQAITDNIPASAPNPVFDELNGLGSGDTGGASSAPSQPTGPVQSGEATAPSASASPSPAAAGSSDDSGSGIFPTAYYVVIALAVALFVTSTVLRRRRRNRPAFSFPPGGPWPAQPQQYPQQPWQAPTGQPGGPQYPQQQPPQQQQWPPPSQSQ